MAETDGTPTDTEPADGEPELTPDQLKAEVEKWKRFSRKHEDRAKANDAAAQELNSIKDMQKSAAEKAADELTAAKEAAAKATEQLLRYEVAAAKGVPAALLAGKTKEDLEAAADELLKWRGGGADPTQQQGAPTAPVPNPLRQGTQGPPAGTDANSLLRRMAGR